MHLPLNRIAGPTRVLSWSAGRILVLSGLVWLLVFGYGRLYLWRDPHGAYFRSETVYELDYSLTRQEEARRFIAHANTTTDLAAPASPPPTRPDAEKTGDHPALCAAFATVRRANGASYLGDSLGSMLAGLDARERRALNVSVVFADAADAAAHPDYGAPWVAALADAAGTYTGLSALQRAGLRQAEADGDLQLKGVFDYVYLLERCLRETAAPFVAVFEDDVVFAADWMARTMMGLQYLVGAYGPGAAAADEAKHGPDWLYLRLFYTETHTGWSERDWWYAHRYLALGLAAGGTAAALLALRLLGCGTRLRLDWATVAVAALVVAPAFATLVFMAGKHNLSVPVAGARLPGRTGGVVPMGSEGCCTQALVFNRRAVPALVAHLRDRSGQTDIMIEEYCDAGGIPRFALSEQAVQHVGLVSSRGMAAADTQSVWAFWFEANRAEAVDQRHRVMVEKVDWDMFGRLAGA